MEFHEKLQQLRKSRGLTQEELAEALFVSRTAISKWESGKGYPSIDSLKEISGFFSVTIDDLLSGERLLSVAESENRTNIRKMCDYLLGIADIMAGALIFLPLYPNSVNGHVYSVDLLSYADAARMSRAVHWTFFLAMAAIGLVKVLLTRFEAEKFQKSVTGLSMGLGILTVLFLAMAREAYAIGVAFLLLVLKGAILLKRVRDGK